jgi:ABC-type lipoprotein export system ATPase subunit
MEASVVRGVEVEVRRVDKDFVRGDQQIGVLRGADLTVAAGEFVAVVGPSGSGKSTLLQLIGGLAPVTSGVVRVNGQRLDALNEDELARFRLSTVGFVFQSYNLISTLSALENAALPLLLANVPHRRALAAAKELLADLGLTGRLDHTPDELSGGELQRVSMARAIITRPPLLLADEPTGSLDSYTGEEVMRLLRRVPKALGQTVILVTHDARAAAYADRIVTLRDGGIREGRRAPAVVS